MHPTALFENHRDQGLKLTKGDQGPKRDQGPEPTQAERAYNTVHAIGEKIMVIFASVDYASHSLKRSQVHRSRNKQIYGTGIRSGQSRF